jgi:hypothetical protein
MTVAAVRAERTFPTFARLDLPVPFAAMLAELRGLLESTWTDHVNQKDYCGGWDVLPLRSDSRHVAAHPVLQAFAIEEASEWSDLPVLGRCPAIMQLLQTLKCPLKAVRLMRLRSGAVIKPHRDRGLCIECGQARLHVPLITNDHVRFLVGGVAVPMQVGELWYVNTDQEHAVTNGGNRDRVNLVIDCEANEWLRHLVSSDSRLISGEGECR